jgi:hypothetical protein
VTVWHYTYDHRLGAILDSGKLLPPALVPNYEASENLQGLDASIRDCKGYKSDKKLLLFSSNQVWEPASYRGVYQKNGNGTVVDLFDVESYDRLGITIHRIGVDTSVLKPWVRLKSIVRMPSWMGQGLEDIAVELGSNPIHDWWGTTVPVPATKWKAVESRINGVWQPTVIEVKEAVQS